MGLVAIPLFRRGATTYAIGMDHLADDRKTPPSWTETLDESEAQIAAGQTVSLEPVLERLRTGAERIEARLRAKADRPA